MWKSTYEIIYKALDYPPNKWDDKKEQTMVVVAESNSDAKIEAEKILKNKDIILYISVLAKD